MDKNEWLRRCEAQFDKQTGNEKANWKDAAEACFDSYFDGFQDDPEGAADEEMSYWDDDKPWKRGTFGIDMKPNKSWNCCGTFCKVCGDWIEDSAYYEQHGFGHIFPRFGSWNFQHPFSRRRSPDDILPNHEQWIEDIRDYADKATRTSGAFSGNGPSINAGLDRAFHSEEEARTVLEPFGCRVFWDKNSGIMNGGVCMGQWSMSGSHDARVKYESIAHLMPESHTK